MFITNLFEAPGKIAVVAFGRLNPPTIGHKKLVDMLVSTPGDAFLFLSHTQKPKDNPLSFAEKKYFAEKFFPGVRIGDESVRTPIDMLKKLEELGYKSVIYVAGSDRVEAFTKLLNDYNGKEYSFDSVEIVSAGDRDPDTDGVEGMSASKMRAAAKAGDFASFKQGVPVPELAQELYNAVRKGMKIVDEAKPGFVGDSGVTEAKRKPARGTLAWEIQQRKRQEYLKGFAQDPHGNKTPATELVGGPSGTSKKVKEAEADRIGKSFDKRVTSTMSDQEKVAKGWKNPVETVYPGAAILKTRNGKAVGEVYMSDMGWGFLHYSSDWGEEGMANKEEAIEALRDCHLERRGKSGDLREAYQWKGKFPFDVDHMPGAVHRDADLVTDSVLVKSKEEWDRAVRSINSKVFDDNSDFLSDRDRERLISPDGVLWAIFDKATGRGWFNAKGRRVKPYSVGNEAVSEAKGLKKRVRVVKTGQLGSIGEVRRGQYKGAPKEFTVDLDDGGSIRASAKELRLVKDKPVVESTKIKQCERCGGKGKIYGASPQNDNPQKISWNTCRDCNGKGSVTAPKKVKPVAETVGNEPNPEEMLAKVNAAIAQKKAQIEKEVALYNQLKQTNEAADNRPRVRSYLNKQGMRRYEVLNSKGVRVNSQEFDNKKSALEYMMSKWPML